MRVKRRKRSDPLPEPDPVWIQEEIEWRRRAKALSERNASSTQSNTSSKLKLTVELVPKPSWGRSLAKLSSRAAWNALRQQVFEKYQGRCAICDGVAKYAHEVWEYDDAALIQRLRDVIPLCELCHQLKHLGRTWILAARGLIVRSRVEYQFLEVNACDLKTFYIHRREAFEVWRERSKYEWVIDWGRYAHLCG